MTNNQTHCIRGHKFTAKNTSYRINGKSTVRRCRLCHAEYQHRYKQWRKLQRTFQCESVSP